MNICGNGICVCEGGSDVIGEDSSCDDSRKTWPSEPPKDWRYYFDEKLGVVISVEPDEMASGVKYYFDPELTNLVNCHMCLRTECTGGCF